MKTFTLNSEHPSKQFKFQSIDSFFNIVQVSLDEPGVDKLDSYWSNILSAIYLEVELKYIINENPRDEREKIFPLHIKIDPDQIQPAFILNTIIKTELFSLGLTNDKWFNQLTLRLAGNLIEREIPNLQIIYEDNLMLEV